MKKLLTAVQIIDTPGRTIKTVRAQLRQGEQIRQASMLSFNSGVYYTESWHPDYKWADKIIKE